MDATRQVQGAGVSRAPRQLEHLLDMGEGDPAQIMLDLDERLADDPAGGGNRQPAERGRREADTALAVGREQASVNRLDQAVEPLFLGPQDEGGAAENGPHPRVVVAFQLRNEPVTDSVAKKRRPCSWDRSRTEFSGLEGNPRCRSGWRRSGAGW